MIRSKNQLKNVFVQAALRYRTEKGLTKEEMAELLGVSPRAYYDQEKGKYCCSGLTLLALFLTLSQEEILQFLEDYSSAAACEAGEETGLPKRTPHDQIRKD